MYCSQCSCTVASPYHLLSIPLWCLVFCPPGVHSEQLCPHCPQSCCLKRDAPHVPDSSLPLHPFLRNYLKFSLIFSLFYLVSCLPFIVHWILKVCSINELISRMVSRTYIDSNQSCLPFPSPLKLEKKQLKGIFYTCMYI